MPKIAFLPWSMRQVFGRFHLDSSMKPSECGPLVGHLGVLGPAHVFWEPTWLLPPNPGHHQ